MDQNEILRRLDEMQQTANRLKAEPSISPADIQILGLIEGLLQLHQFTINEMKKRRPSGPSSD